MSATPEWTAGLAAMRAVSERARVLSDMAWQLAIKNAARAHPDTGGSPLLVHNWGNDAARAAMRRKDRRTDIIYSWQQREHARIWRTMR